MLNDRWMQERTAILFDLDDTLFDRATTITHYLRNRLASRLANEAMTEAFTRRFHELDHRGYADRSAVFMQLAIEFPAAGPADSMRADFRDGAWREAVSMPGAIELLSALRAHGYRLGIVTNGSAAVQRAKLAHSGMAAMVDAVVISGEEGIAKPAPEIFRLAAARLSTAPPRCVFVGDHLENDVRGAMNAGMTAVWLRGKQPWPSGIAPVDMIDALSELLPFLAARRAMESSSQLR